MEDKILIFTDLDGTLLDHKTYDYSQISEFINFITSKALVIPNSSKTYEEVKALSDSLYLSSPFIVENGSAIYFPKDDKFNFQTDPEEIDDHNYFQLGAKIDELESFIYSAKLEKFSKYCSFLNEMTISEIIEYTSLSERDAKHAMKRDFSLPFLWKGDKNTLNQFKAYVISKKFKILEGGRFYHLIGNTDKGKALKFFLNMYKNSDDLNNVLTIAIGDSQNDNEMLLESQFSGIVKSASNKSIDMKNKNNTFYSSSSAPIGWQEVLMMMPPISKLKKREK